MTKEEYSTINIGDIIRVDLSYYIIDKIEGNIITCKDVYLKEKEIKTSYENAILLSSIYKEYVEYLVKLAHRFKIINFNDFTIGVMVGNYFKQHNI